MSEALRARRALQNLQTLVYASVDWEPLYEAEFDLRYLRTQAKTGFDNKPSEAALSAAAENRRAARAQVARVLVSAVEDAVCTCRVANLRASGGQHQSDCRVPTVQRVLEDL